MPDIVSIQVQRLPIVAATSQGDMHMRVLGIVMGNCRPFERRAEILSHAPHHVSCEPIEVDAFAKLRRNDHLPNTVVA
jgi:hypothetical protein